MNRTTRIFMFKAGQFRGYIQIKQQEEKKAQFNVDIPTFQQFQFLYNNQVPY